MRSACQLQGKDGIAVDRERVLIIPIEQTEEWGEVLLGFESESHVPVAVGKLLIVATFLFVFTCFDDKQADWGRLLE